MVIRENTMERVNQWYISTFNHVLRYSVMRREKEKENGQAGHRQAVFFSSPFPFSQNVFVKARWFIITARRSFYLREVYQLELKVVRMADDLVPVYIFCIDFWYEEHRGRSWPWSSWLPKFTVKKKKKQKKYRVYRQFYPSIPARISSELNWTSNKSRWQEIYRRHVFCQKERSNNRKR